tara:strand:+ start:394 stop:1344 length:951 start_codon:yes stop_codon:yes gene_type:complete
MPYLGRAPTVANNVTGDLAVSGSILADGQISGGRINHKLALDGSDASSPQANENDQFLIEDGGSDGSGTNAGDNILLENATGGQAISGDIIGEGIPISSIAGAGTSGQFLQSQGTGLSPTFATVSGTYDLHSQGSFSSATVSEVAFTSLTHDFYLLHLWNVQISASEPLMIAISYDNGSNYSNDGGAATALTDDWYSTNHCTRNNGDIATEGRHGTSSGQTEITGYSSTYKPAAGAPQANLFGTMTIERKKDGELYPGGMHDWSYHNAGYAPVRCNGAWFHTASGGTQGDVDAFKIYPNSGHFTDIHFKLYGCDVT